MRDVWNIRFVSFLALGVAWGVEMRPIENREGEGALAFDGQRLNNKYNNQPKVGIRGGGVFGRARNRGGTCVGDVIPSFWAANQATKYF